MTFLEAAVWCFWGAVVLSALRMLLAYKRSTSVDAQVKALRDELAALNVKSRLESLEAGQLSLNNKVESAKVTPMRNRRGWG